MFETLQRLYWGGKITEKELARAAERGWITQEQKEEIMSV